MSRRRWYIRGGKVAGGGQKAHGSISQSIGELACCRVGVSATAMHCLVACNGRASVRPSKCLSVPSIDSRNGGRRLANAGSVMLSAD